MQVWILGCGYTGRRAARRLVAEGVAVTATTRSGEVGVPGVTPVAFDGTAPLALPEGARVLHSIPPSAGDVEALLGGAPARVVYLSSTGVYGLTPEVDETTPAAPATDAQRARLAAEERVRAGPWSTLVLRPAAIYGPDRGVHVAMRAGRYALAGDGSNITSRIHVDDLAAHCVAALRADLEGAWPVADAHPCPARELAEWCAQRFGLPPPTSRDPAELHETLRFTRRVDGSAVRAALGVELRYPSYRDAL
jgi:nucleoside-diphosphate-sugar epimerase